MFQYSSSDDSMINYHEVDHLKLSLPLRDDHDEPTFEECDKTLRIVGYSSQIPIHQISRKSLVFVAGAKICGFHIETQRTLVFKNDKFVFGEFLKFVTSESLRYLGTLSQNGIGIWDSKLGCLDDFIKIENVIDITWVSEENDSSPNTLATLRESGDENVLKEIQFWTKENHNAWKIIETIKLDSNVKRLFGAGRSVLGQGSFSVVIMTKILGESPHFEQSCCHIDQNLRKEIGHFTTTSTNDSLSMQAWTGTSKGKLIGWNFSKMKESSETCFEIFPTNLTLITTIQQTSKFLIAGDNRGAIGLFGNESSGLVHLSKFQLTTDPIASITYFKDLSYVTVSDLNSRIFQFFPRSSKNDEKTRFLIDFSLYHGITAMDVHPKGPLLVCANSKGKLLMIDAESFEILDIKILTRNQTEVIEIVKYSPEGRTLVCCTSNGKVWTFQTSDSLSMTSGGESESCPPFGDSSGRIAICKFFTDVIFATADSHHNIAIYSQEKKKSWIFLVKCQPHSKMISDFLLIKSSPEEVLEIFSVGSDRTLAHCQFDLSSRKIAIKSSRQLEDVPTFIHSIEHKETGERFLLIGNCRNQIQVLNAKTNFCRRIVRFPSSKQIEEINFGNSRKHLFFVSRTLSGHFVQLSALSLNCPTPHSLACIPWSLANSGLKYCISSDGGLFCASVNSDFIEHHQHFAATEVLSKGLSEDVQLNCDVHDDVQTCLQSLIDVSSTNLIEAVNIKQVPIILEALGIRPSELEMENFLNEFQFGRSMDFGFIDEEISIQQFLVILYNHFDYSALSATI